MSMTGVEVDFVVKDSLEALKLYQSIFDVEPLEVNHFAPGTNEVVFTLYGVRIHLLDENPDYHLVAPKEGQAQPMWLNVMVPDIEATYQKALAAGCTPVQPVTRMEAFGISNAMFKDPFGYVWLLLEMHRVVSHQERVRILEEQFGKQQEPKA